MTKRVTRLLAGHRWLLRLGAAAFTLAVASQVQTATVQARYDTGCQDYCAGYCAGVCEDQGGCKESGASSPNGTVPDCGCSHKCNNPF
jgi:hypothetical protein